ncbi:APC family permease [Salinicola endophyticus]|uniref:APC family permease n=1 Tax=Salinicola endophyticus TaxID=1949083 RepID=A0ABY8FL32_9GAMM|nr:MULTISPECIES: APC family permease [Salinicola]WFF41336.1 APC family permease [Salinicola endophyticus]
MNVTSSPTTELRRGALGVGFIIFFVVSAASPFSVLAGGFPIGIMLGNGAGTPSLILMVLAILLLFSVGYTTMARHVTDAGGFYAFSTRGLGPIPGGAVGGLALFAYNILQIGLYGMFGGVAAGTLKALFGLSLPWWLCALLAMASISAFGYRKIDLSAKVLCLIVMAEYGVILVLDIAILSSGGAHGVDFASFQAESVLSGSPSIGLLFCFAAFIGFEATTIYGEEAKNPRRDIPLATYASILLIGFFYTFSTWSMIVGVGSDRVVETLVQLKDPTVLIYGLADHYVGSALTQIARVLFLVSIYAGLLAFHNSAARYFYAIGRDGLLPGALGRTHPRHRSPYVGSLVQTLIAAAAVLIFAACGSDPILELFAWFSSLAALSLILLMALTSLAVACYFQRHPELGVGVWRGRLLPLLASALLLGVMVIAVAHFDVLTGSSKMLSYALCLLIVLSLAIGGLMAMRLRRAEPERFSQLGLHRI